MKRYDRLVGALLRGRSHHMFTGSIASMPDNDAIYLDALRTVFGLPADCLACGADVRGQAKRPKDLDSWFCSNCCPVCHG